MVLQQPINKLLGNYIEVLINPGLSQPDFDQLAPGNNRRVATLWTACYGMAWYDMVWYMVWYGIYFFL